MRGKVQTEQVGGVGAEDCGESPFIAAHAGRQVDHPIGGISQSVLIDLVTNLGRKLEERKMIDLRRLAAELRV